MTINFAIEYIPRKMRELGFENDQYTIRFRSFAVARSVPHIIDAFGGEYFLLVEEYENLTIESEAGLYFKNVGTLTTNENIYEHHGRITIVNVGNIPQYVKMIQVIPKHINTKN